MNKSEQKKVQQMAQAIREKRIRDGEWGGSVRSHHEYQDRPLEWIVEHLDVPEETLRWSDCPEYKSRPCASQFCDHSGPHQWDGDKDPLVLILDKLAGWKDVGCESATGTGKSYLAALIIFWFLACHKDSIVVTAAPKEDQLLLHIWKEIGALWPRFQRHFPQAQHLTGKIRMASPDSEAKEKWAATAFVCGVGASEEVATKAQGFHAEHMLIITEETPGIHPAIMNAFYNTRTDDHNLHLALGNPDHRHDALHQFCENPEVEQIRISAYDHPNVVTGRRVVPGAIGQKRLRDRIRKLGKGTRLYESRVRGISPSESEEALIRREWCEAAAKRWDDEGLRDGPPALGVDVANSPRGDKSAIARWEGACLTEVWSGHVEDAGELGRLVYDEIMSRDIDPRHVGVDPVGVGASTINELKRLGLRVREIDARYRAIPSIDVEHQWRETREDTEGRMRPTGPAVVESERWNNLRSQVWWRIREDLRMQRIALPNDEELFRDLTAPQWSTKNGKIYVEQKDEIKSRIGRSPDKGDSAAFGNFVRARRPERSSGTGGRDTTNAPNKDRGLERMATRRKREIRAQRREMDRVKRMLDRAPRRRQ